MGLDTYANVKSEGKERERFIEKCKGWLKKNKLKSTDVDVFLDKKDENNLNSHRWGACHSRILAGDISKVQGMDFPFSYMKNFDFDFMVNMNVKETLEMGKRCLEFLEKAIKELPKGHKIANGYKFDKNNKIIPAGFRDTKESLEYAKKQARWFIMVGECGYETQASY